MDRGAWQATEHEVTIGHDWAIEHARARAHTHTHTHTHTHHARTHTHTHTHPTTEAGKKCIKRWWGQVQGGSP